MNDWTISGFCNRAAIAGLCLGAAACASRPPATVNDIRDAAQAQNSVVDVLPLGDDDSARQLEVARRLEAEGRLKDAVRALDRGLNDFPDEPRLLQTRAELHLALKKYSRAIADATQAYIVGPKIGELCARSWRTTSAARQARGDTDGAAAAMDRARGCSLTPPPRY